MLAPLLLASLLAVPSAAVQPPRARPGDAVVVTVAGAASPPAGTLLGRPLRFYAAGAERWLAVAPLPTEAAPGPASLELTADGAPVQAALQVTRPSFRTTRLKVAPRFLDPPASEAARIAADSAALAEAYAQPFEPLIPSSPFAWPRRAEVTGRYGDQRTYNGTVSRMHYGIDLDGPTGAPVAAAADGLVVLARDCFHSGWTTVVWHGAGLYTAYLHQSAVEVAPGARVVRGQQIGRVGSTGRSTGPHLHWGVKVDGLWVDPESVLRLDLLGGPGGDATPPPRPALP